MTNNQNKQTETASTRSIQRQENVQLHMSLHLTRCPRVSTDKKKIKNEKNEDQEAWAKGDQGRPAVIRISKSQV